jgi:DnaJ-class molecular chaperone
LQKWHPDKRVDDDAVSQERALARYLEIQEAYTGECSLVPATTCS